MLILSRRPGERIIVNGDIVFEILEVKGKQIRLGITAPKHITVHREEVAQRIQENAPYTSKKAA